MGCRNNEDCTAPSRLAPYLYAIHAHSKIAPSGMLIHQEENTESSASIHPSIHPCIHAFIHSSSGSDSFGNIGSLLLFFVGRFRSPLRSFPNREERRCDAIVRTELCCVVLCCVPLHRHPRCGSDRAKGFRISQASKQASYQTNERTNERTGLAELRVPHGRSVGRMESNQIESNRIESNSNGIGDSNPVLVRFCFFCVCVCV